MCPCGRSVCPLGPKIFTQSTPASTDDSRRVEALVAVAEVLAYVYQLRAYKKGEGDYPDRPTRLKVPAEMDPLNPASQQRPAPDNGASE